MRPRPSRRDLKADSQVCLAAWSVKPPLRRGSAERNTANNATVPNVASPTIRGSAPSSTAPSPSAPTSGLRLRGGALAELRVHGHLAQEQHSYAALLLQGLRRRRRRLATSVARVRQPTAELPEALDAPIEAPPADDTWNCHTPTSQMDPSATSTYRWGWRCGSASPRCSRPCRRVLQYDVNGVDLEPMRRAPQKVLRPHGLLAVV